jgi:hypothetical protein|tara:strand:- start:2806 stop:3000 length:195 start_codon:yes stop_codon:yes gene_type:complete
MKIKNKFTGEIKDYEYDFMGKAEAKRLLQTGQWEKVKKDPFAIGDNIGIKPYGVDLEDVEFDED